MADMVLDEIERDRQRLWAENDDLREKLAEAEKALEEIALMFGRPYLAVDVITKARAALVRIRALKGVTNTTTVGAGSELAG